MPKKDLKKRYADLTWKDLDNWAGNRIVTRGRNYQRQERVSDLAITDDGVLVAWVEGTRRYAVKVSIDNKGRLHSYCTCPYDSYCKHAVAVVLEYLDRIQNDREVPEVDENNNLVDFLEEDSRATEELEEEPAASENHAAEIETFLKGKNKSQLIELVLDITSRHPNIADELAGRSQLLSGNIKSFVTRLRRDIRDIGDEPGWQNYWNGEGFTPDYSDIRSKLDILLKDGYFDDVLSLGEKLITSGMSLVEISHDDGETAMEIEQCMPLIVKALDRSSLAPADKLMWALDAVLKDNYYLCETLDKYLMKQHTRQDWSVLADRLLGRLEGSGYPDGKGKHNYQRNKLCNWVIYALEEAGRKAEILPLCEAEAPKTCSYQRLVTLLIKKRRYEDAKHWIREGIQATKEQYPGIAEGLRRQLQEIYISRKDWLTVSAIRAEEFVLYPSERTFTECKKSADKTKVWPEVRECFMEYLEKGMLPWKQKKWPLPESGLVKRKASRYNQFPIINILIDIAILEKKPDCALFWYDKIQNQRFGGYPHEDKLATAVQNYAPERSVVIWKNIAERCIAQVKPSAYKDAAVFLRKAAHVMKKEKKQDDWNRYIKELRMIHARKIRLMEVLDDLQGESRKIIKR